MQYKFSGHQTFVFRYGWLEKGVRLIQSNPKGFNDKNVLANLGVGKNMVESIKYWCLQIGLLKPCDNGFQLTDLATKIFGKNDDSGWDPFLEDEATLWLLHWSLMQRPLLDDTWSTWQYAFFKWYKSEFSKKELTSAISDWVTSKAIALSTIERDVDCFVRNYAGTRGPQSEESFDSPFLALELIQNTDNHELYRFNTGEKMNLPAEIVGYAILKWMNKGSNQLLSACLYDEMSPGQIFRLTEEALVNYLDQLISYTKQKLTISETAGMKQIIFKGQSKETAAKYADELLESYYGKARA